MRAVTAVTVEVGGASHTVAAPRGFRDCALDVERIDGAGLGERVSIFAGDVRLGMMVHERHRAARITLERMGHARLRPGGGGAWPT